MVEAALPQPPAEELDRNPEQSPDFEVITTATRLISTVRDLTTQGLTPDAIAHTISHDAEVIELRPPNEESSDFLEAA